MTEADIVIRPARDDDDLDSLNAQNPDWTGEALTRELFAGADGARHEMFVAELAGEPAGYGHAVALGLADGRRGIGMVYVHPRFRGRGIGTKLWQRVLQVCVPDAVPGVMLKVDAADETSQAVLLAHGLSLAGHHIESELDLHQTDRLRAAATRHPLDNATIAPLANDATDQQWRDFASVFQLLLMDAPDNASGAEPMPYDTLRTFLPEPWQVMCAWHDDRLVGFTSVMIRDEPSRRLNTLFTAVVPEWRAHGLATSLKVQHALALAAAGWHSIRTQNMEGNEPILASNRRLGFTPVSEIIDVVYDHPSAGQPLVTR